MTMFIFGFITAVVVMVLYSVCAINGTAEREKEEAMMREYIESKSKEHEQSKV